MKKKILFVINTFSRAGAEQALLALLKELDPEKYRISLFILTAQGEMIPELPSYVEVINPVCYQDSVLSQEGKKRLTKKVFHDLLVRGTGLRLCGYLIRNLWDMLCHKSVALDKLMWRVLSDSALRSSEEYDLAVAYIEGGSSYYVAEHVKAKKKAAFIHIAYNMTRKLDRDCYHHFDKIFSVSSEVKARFLEAYPEHADKAEVFHNLLDTEEIIRKSILPGGFTDGYTGMRILSVGRLTTQKAYEVSIEAMKLLKDAGRNIRWYVLGEGDQRKKLEKKIDELGLAEDFILCGAVDNPYPYFAQTDLYVHASRYEGKSIAVQEAQILGCPVLVSDCMGNRGQVIEGVDGLICSFTPEAVRDGIIWMLEHPDQQKKYAEAATEKYFQKNDELNGLLALMNCNEEEAL